VSQRRHDVLLLPGTDPRVTCRVLVHEEEPAEAPGTANAACEERGSQCQLLLRRAAAELGASGMEAGAREMVSAGRWKGTNSPQPIAHSGRGRVDGMKHSAKALSLKVPQQNGFVMAWRARGEARALCGTV